MGSLYGPWLRPIWILGTGTLDRGLDALVQQMNDRRQVLSGQFGR
jgi:hypothetical protein